MSKIAKLLEKLRNRQTTLTYSELKKLLFSLGYIEDTKGQTSGSRVVFINTKTKHVIMMHKPHGKDLKAYQQEQVRDALKEKGILS